MEKKLIVEINRINNLMNLTKIQINEASGVPGVLGFIIRKLETSLGDDVFFRLLTKTENEDYQLRQILNRSGKKLENLTEDEFKLLMSKFIDTKTLAKTLYENDVIFTPAAKSTYVNSIVEKLKDNPKDYNQIISDVKNGTKNFYGLFDETNYPAGIPKELQKFSQEWGEIVEKQIDELFEKLYPKEYKIASKTKWAAQETSKIKPSSGDEVQKMYKKIPPQKYSTAFIPITGLLKKQTATADMITKLCKTYVESNDVIVKTQTLKLIEENMSKLAEDGKNTFNALNMWIEKNISNTPELKDISDHLSKMKDWNKLKEFAKYSTKTQLSVAFRSAWVAFNNSTGVMFRSILRIIPEIFTFGTKSKQMTTWFNKWKMTKETEEVATDEFKKNFIDPLSNWFKTGSRRGKPFVNTGPKGEEVFNPNYGKIIDIYGQKTAIWSYRIEVIMTIIRFHIYYVIALTFAEAMAFNRANAASSDGGKVWKITSDLAKRYNQVKKLQTNAGGTLDVFLPVFLENLKNEFDPTTLTLWGLASHYFPGFTDELIRDVLKPIFDRYFSGTLWSDVEGGLEDVESRAKDVAEKNKQKVQKTIQQGNAETTQDTTGSPVKTPTIVSSDSSQVTPDPDGFKKFLELKGETGTFNSADSIGTDSKGNDYYYDINDKTFQPLD